MWWALDTGTCVFVLQEPSQVLLPRRPTLSRGDSSEPAVLGSRWMSGVWVKMCFCPLFSGDFHSALSRAHSPGQGAPLLPPCAGETRQMYLDMIHSGASETVSHPSSFPFLCVPTCVFIPRPEICCCQTETKYVHRTGHIAALRFLRSSFLVPHVADCRASSLHIQRMKSPEGTGL